MSNKFNLFIFNYFPVEKTPLKTFTKTIRVRQIKAAFKFIGINLFKSYNANEYRILEK